MYRGINGEEDFVKLLVTWDKYHWFEINGLSD